MRHILYKTILIATVLLFGCSKSELEVVNKNEPSITSLATEKGVINAGLGIYASDAISGEGGLLSFNYLWLSLTNHEVMGDALFVPWGNFGWRWINQVGQITLDDGTIVLPPQGGTQKQEIDARNTRDLGDDNPTKHEWLSMYNVNNTANLMITLLDEGITFSGDATTKENTLRAWAHFWKGYAYSRIGSMYAGGLILNEYGQTAGDFVSNTAVLAEAEAQFQQATTLLNGLSSGGDYDEVMGALLPDLALASSGQIPSPAEWLRNINSLRARNLLVNKKISDMTTADWTEVSNLANAGIQSGDYEFTVVSDGEFFSSIFTAYRVLIGWAFASERLIQDFKAGDARLDRFFETDAATINARGRGIQYGTRYYFKESSIASTSIGGAPTYLGATYEENELMKAEAAINSGSIETGLQIIDNIRDFQTAGLADVAGTGLTLAEAQEELRSERRVALLLRGLAFYDARRQGILDPVSEGGGRTGCVVLEPTMTGFDLNTNATFDYNYYNYWPVPANELDFNAPVSGAENVSAR